jgi:hypothetical protein
MVLRSSTLLYLDRYPDIPGSIPADRGDLLLPRGDFCNIPRATILIDFEVDPTQPPEIDVVRKSPPWRGARQGGVGKSQPQSNQSQMR